MKKALAGLLTGLLLCGVFMLGASAAEDITAAFTDPVFRAEVYAIIGKTAPEPILDTDVEGIIQLMVGDNIASLAGLEYFTGLRRFNCISSQITSLPALPPSLEEINCSYNNQLTSLPTLPASLMELVCYHNQLTSLPALPTGLTRLKCDNNQLTSLPALPAGLTRLDCFYNNLTSLPAPLPPALERLSCFGNQLTSLDVTGCPLKYLDCRVNNLASKSDVIGFTGTWDGVNFLFDPQNKGILGTNIRYNQWWAYILFFLCFGFIWMWF